MLNPENAYRQPASMLQVSSRTQRRAQRYPPPPATAIFRQSSGTMAHGINLAGTARDSQKNGLPSR